MVSFVAESYTLDKRSSLQPDSQFTLCEKHNSTELSFSWAIWATSLLKSATILAFCNPAICSSSSPLFLFLWSDWRFRGWKFKMLREKKTDEALTFCTAPKNKSVVKQATWSLLHDCAFLAEIHPLHTTYSGFPCMAFIDGFRQRPCFLRA